MVALVAWSSSWQAATIEVEKVVVLSGARRGGEMHASPPRVVLPRLLRNELL
jgi:hypothetical protein